MGTLGSCLLRRPDSVLPPSLTLSTPTSSSRPRRVCAVGHRRLRGRAHASATNAEPRSTLPPRLPLLLPHPSPGAATVLNPETALVAVPLAPSSFPESACEKVLDPYSMSRGRSPSGRVGVQGRRRLGVASKLFPAREAPGDPLHQETLLPVPFQRGRPPVPRVQASRQGAGLSGMDFSEGGTGEGAEKRGREC